MSPAPYFSIFSSSVIGLRRLSTSSMISFDGAGVSRLTTTQRMMATGRPKTPPQALGAGEDRLSNYFWKSSPLSLSEA